MVVLFKLLSMFGPLPDGLVKHANGPGANELLRHLWQAVKENDEIGGFADWSEDVFPNLTDEAKRLILRMTNLDADKRATMTEIVRARYLEEDGSRNDTQHHSYNTDEGIGRHDKTNDMRPQEGAKKTSRHQMCDQIGIHSLNFS